MNKFTFNTIVMLSVYLCYQSCNSQGFGVNKVLYQQILNNFILSQPREQKRFKCGYEGSDRNQVVQELIDKFNGYEKLLSLSLMINKRQIKQK